MSSLFEYNNVRNIARNLIDGKLQPSGAEAMILARYVVDIQEPRQHPDMCTYSLNSGHERAHRQSLMNLIERVHAARNAHHEIPDKLFSILQETEQLFWFALAHAEWRMRDAGILKEPQ
jgi:hypothetical protein